MVDDSGFPVVVVTFPERPEEAMFDAYFAHMEDVMKRGPIAFVVDIRKISMRETGAELRRLFFKRVAERDLAQAGYPKICEAIVSASSETRAIIATYMWQVQPRGFESRVFETLEAAQAWARERVSSVRVKESA